MGFISDAFNTITGKSAAKDASKAQQQATESGMAEQARQFDALQALMKPYVESGSTALQSQNNLLGLNGYDSQQSAISGIENSPFFQSQYQQAENAMLQNASATGGLRGGNIQEALADNRSNMLYGNVQNQLSALSGVASNGQSAAAGLGGQGIAYGNNVAQGYNDIGSAQAGYSMYKSNLYSGLLNQGIQAGAAAMGGGFGGASAAGTSGNLPALF